MQQINPFGTHNDWSTWTGVEIGERILHFLNSKMDQSPDERKVHQDAESSGSSQKNSGEMPHFFNYSEPPITLDGYIRRLIYYTRISVSPVNLAVALLYIDRIERKGLCKITKHSIFRLFSTAYLVAFKHTEDSKPIRNSEYCKIAGISLSELNQLELSFLMAMNFELGVGADIAISQRITRILVPPKVSTEILLSEKQSPIPDIHRITPDSVVDLESDRDQYDEEREDFFDRIFVTNNNTHILKPKYSENY